MRRRPRSPISPLEDNLAPVRKGARIIKEISWRWREIGADSRICDLLDSQVSAIEASCGQISEIDPRPDVSAAFDLIRDKIDGFGESGRASGPAAPNDATCPPPPATARSPRKRLAVQEVPVGDVAPDAAGGARGARGRRTGGDRAGRSRPDEPVEAAVSAIDAARTETP